MQNLLHYVINNSSLQMKKFYAEQIIVVAEISNPSTWEVGGFWQVEACLDYRTRAHLKK